jgi:hypothetical protein
MARPRRRARWPFVLLTGLVVLLVLLVVADRVAVAYADRQVARQLQSHGFPGTPHVAIEGFPFLTQLAARDVRDVHITASGLREGPVTASLAADATDVRLDPGYRGGVITRARGTLLIGFASVASIARNAGAPGVTASAAGADRIKFRVNLGVVSTNVIASITQADPRTFQLHILSAGGLPASVLGSFSSLTFRAPALPYGIAIRSISVTSAGVVGHVAAQDIRFTR